MNGYTDREHLSMLDYLKDYDFDYSQADNAELRALARRALAAGWKRSAGAN